MAKPTKLQQWQLTTRSDFLAERYALDVMNNKTVRAALFESRSDEIRHLQEIKGFLATAFLTGFYAGLGGSEVMTQMMRNDEAETIAILQKQFDERAAARKAALAAIRAKNRKASITMKKRVPRKVA